jgi:hypothetical protein
MVQEFPYKVKWILAPLDGDRAGLYGTTTHPSRTPASAALASAESVLNSLTEDRGKVQIHIVSVFANEPDRNLLSSEDLRAALRYHDKLFLVDVVYRPLC